MARAPAGGGRVSGARSPATSVARSCGSSPTSGSKQPSPPFRTTPHRPPRRGRTGTTVMRAFPLAVTVACVIAAAILAAGCASTADAPGAPVASRLDSGPPTAPCNTDYCDPLDWATAQTSTPLTQIPPFVEPLNVVISARSTVPLADIEQALGKWKTVSTATAVNLAGIRLKCISSEKAG